MKKTIQAQIAGSVFMFEEGAYDLIRDYLSRSEKSLSPEDKKEIVLELEIAIADRLKNRKSSFEAVTLDEAEDMITKMGEVDHSSETKGGKTNTGKPANLLNFKRDKDGALLTGLLAGLANSTKYSVSMVRFIFVGIALFTTLATRVWWLFPLIYILLSLLTESEHTLQAKDLVTDMKSGSTRNQIKSVLSTLRTTIKTTSSFLGKLISLTIGVISAAGLSVVIVGSVLAIWWLYSKEMPESARSISMILMIISVAAIFIIPFVQKVSRTFIAQNHHNKKIDMAVCLIWLLLLGSSFGLVNHNISHGKFEDIARENPTRYLRYIQDDLGERLCIKIGAANCVGDNPPRAFYQPVCGREVLVLRSSNGWANPFEDLGFRESTLTYAEGAETLNNAANEYKAYCESIENLTTNYPKESFILGLAFSEDDFKPKYHRDYVQSYGAYCFGPNSCFEQIQIWIKD